MTYASVSDLKAVIPLSDLRRLTDFDGAVDAEDDARLVSALEDASAEINGWIEKRVSLPLANPPRMLAVVCRDLAYFRLFANLGGGVPETVENLRAAAITWLKAVADGRVSIGDETAGDDVSSSPGVVVESGEAPVFTRYTLRGL